MGRLNVAWLNQWDPLSPHAGGAERTLGELAKRLAARGVDLTIYSEAVPGMPREISVDGYRIVRPAGPVGLRLWVLANFQARARGGPHFDVAIHDLAKILPWRLPLLGDAAPPLVFVHHIFGRHLLGDSSPLQGVLAIGLERAIPYLYRGAITLTETEYTKSILVGLGVPASRIRLVRPGIDSKYFVPDLSRRSSVPLISYVGRLKTYKRVDLAIRALGMLRRRLPDAVLQIAGTGSDQSRLQRIVSTLGLDDGVTFKGHVTEAELKRLYQESWVNVQPSVVEGYGLTVLEAAACGTPTVAFRNSVFPETVGPLSERYLAVDGDSSSLASMLGVCLENVRSNPDEVMVDQVGFARRFDWDRAADQWFEVLEQRAGVQTGGKSLEAARRAPVVD